MQHCLKLTLQCPVSQTAFCVGSTLFLPDTSDHYPALKPYFTAFPLNDPDPSGLILADGWSRQIPGNTHAEANALTNFRTKYAGLVKGSSASASSSSTTSTVSNIGSNVNGNGETVAGSNVLSSSYASDSSFASGSTGTHASSRTINDLPPIEQVLRDSDCYATMEPCSVRTSGGPSCALELVRAKVRKVYLGVEEPPDFVQCEGVRILEEGGVEVGRVIGLEQDCLRAARRGRS
jgi:pyrimidine deaminase RibD-like protein